MNKKPDPRTPKKHIETGPAKSKPVGKMDETDRAAHREAALEPSAKSVAARKPVAAPPTVQHTVASGETLSHISDRYYKTPNRWREIYEVNKGVIGDNPGMIKPGQVLVIPNIAE